MTSALSFRQERVDAFKEEDLKKLLNVAQHSEGVESGRTMECLCDNYIITDHEHLDEFMPELAVVVHKGIDSPGEGPISLSEHLTFEHVERAQFTAFRRLIGLNEESYVKSVEGMNGGATEPSGKSGSLFWFSPDKSVLLKSITQSEVDKIVEILDDYIAHFQSAKSEGRLVLLTQFFGVYKISVGDESVSLLAMNNVFGKSKPSRTYDIKGTTEDRYVEPGPGVVMKDLNYAGIQVGLKQSDVDSLLRAAEADSTFLESNNIMDYSLLLGVYDNPRDAGQSAGGSTIYQGIEVEDGESTVARAFQMGIIDVLVDYSGKKIAAHCLKKPTLGLCMCQEIDTEPPPYYQTRFYDNAEDKIIAA